MGSIPEFARRRIWFRAHAGRVQQQFRSRCRHGAVEIPEPGLLLVVKVNDDTIFNRIDQELKKNPQVVSVDKAGLKMRTMPLPPILPINLRPTAASSGGYLFIASSDALVQ